MPKINYRRLDKQPKKRDPVAATLSDEEYKPKRIENKKKEKIKRRQSLKSVVNSYNNGLDVNDEFD